MADRKLTQEELLEAEAFFNLASMLGKSIQSAVYQMDHPDYNPEVMAWSESKDGEPDTAADEESDNESAPEAAQLEPEPVIHSGEANIDNQIVQIALLIHDDRLKELIGTCALYPMLRLAAEQFSLNPDDPSSNLSTVDMKKAAIAWAIVKRVFAVRHPDETLRILNIADSIRGDVFLGTPPQAFRPMDKTDAEMIVETCGLFVSDFDPNISEQSDLEKMLTQISASGKIMIPVSKAYRKQREIAASGVERDLNVGRGAIIKASITGKDGKPLGLSMFEMDIEATIGQLFQENGFKTLCLSPAQIYRKYAELPSDATVSPAEIKETIEAMDKLIITPATLDFTEQIEKHTRLKRKEGFDYENPKRRGTLITGVHDMNPVRTHNGYKIVDSFTIHEMPMFYAYSYAIGQMYTIPAYYLTGEESSDPTTTKKIKTKKKTDQQRRISKEDVGLRRYLLEYIEYQKGEWEKRDRNLRRNNKPVPPYFEFDLPFDSIAKDIFKGNVAAQQRAEAAQLRAEAANKKKPQPKTKAGATEKQLRSLREQTYDFMCMQVKLGNIRKCEYYKSGRSLRGVKIRL